jgi:hypothetical protein
MLRVFYFLVLQFSALEICAQNIHHGHAHNDYEHKRPLTDALKFHFRSIEIDVWLHKEKIVVSHVNLALDAKKTIEQLYLIPLIDTIEKHGGKIYNSDSAALILMIDFKHEGAATYKKLKEVIAPFRKYFMVWNGDSVIQKGPLSILISGAVPRNEIAKDSERIACIDGNINDTLHSASPVLIPRISSSWGRLFSWRGTGKIPNGQRQLLRNLVTASHNSGKTIRFWAAPDKIKAWKVLEDEKADWVNTNKSKAFHLFSTQ